MVDSNEAPEGYKAVASINGCTGCVFDKGDGTVHCAIPIGVKNNGCNFFCRHDHSEVIFIKKEVADENI